MRAYVRADGDFERAGVSPVRSGTNSVESKKGVGSVFTVELPMELTDESRVKKQDAPIARESLNGVKVLTPMTNTRGAPLFIP